MCRLITLSVFILSVGSLATPLMSNRDLDLKLMNETSNDDYHATCLPIDNPDHHVKDPYQFCIPLVKAIGDGDQDEVLNWKTAQKRWESPETECELVWQPRTYQHMDFSTTRGILYDAALRFEQCFHRWQEAPAINRGSIDVPSDGADSTMSYHLKRDLGQVNNQQEPAQSGVKRDFVLPSIQQGPAPVNDSSNGINIPECIEAYPGAFHFQDPFQFCAPFLQIFKGGDPNELITWNRDGSSWRSPDGECIMQWVPGDIKEFQTVATRGRLWLAALSLQEACFPGWDDYPPIQKGDIRFESVYGTARMFYTLKAYDGQTHNTSASIKLE